MEDPSTDLRPLFDAILKHIPPPVGDPDGVLQMLIANLDYSDYLGRLGIGRVFNGTLRYGDEVAIAKRDGTMHNTKITKLYSFEGLKRVDETVGRPGDMLAIAGVEGITIGETVTSAETPEPAAAHSDRRAHHRDGVHHQHLAVRRTRRPVGHLAQSARPARQGTADQRFHPRRRSCGHDTFKVMGRGELQLAILIEMMRREGYELAVGKPEILTRTIDGKLKSRSSTWSSIARKPSSAW